MNIAERLKELNAAYEKNASQENREKIERECGFFIDEIITAQQFAEDMQTLTDTGKSPRFYQSVANRVVCSIDSVSYHGADFFAAARRAVEGIKK